MILSPCLALAGEPVALFNGNDLSGWTAVLADENAKAEDVWSVHDGVLHCKGQPVGYIKTEKEYSNYELSLQWRFPQGSQGGNSGVLVHTSEPGAIGIWPKSIEVQLHRGDAGDFWVIGTDLNVKNEEERKMGRRHLNLTDDSENPIGEWNTMVIVCQKDRITVTVNGDLVNEASDCSVTAGAISLQSEGAPIEFREIVLTPLDE
ncbi:3-keto-disaccharide hydrolase [Tautonia marina]|uniref:3-keto-disaccharide hydrolase n=1 Tax=Tautonia marina TaxID=2653855 RepID=UPI00191C24AD|nr:DUF1080 domain-containing protein [Tautonia marina]